MHAVEYGSMVAWYRARTVITGNKSVIENGVLAVDEGHIVAVSSYAGQPLAEDFGDGALLPGFINAHTHLDLSHLERPEQAPSHFADWLRNVVEARRRVAANDEELRRRILTRAGEMLVAGTTFVGDIATSALSAEGLHQAGLPGIVFQEIVGLRPERFAPLVDEAKRRNSELPASLFPGLSPHAPYSTARQAYQRAIASARHLATHFAESPDEMEYYRTGGGPMRDFLEAIGAWNGEPPSVEVWLNDWLGDEGCPCLLVHANYAVEAMDGLVAAFRRGRVSGVVWCPRTSDWFGHGPHPWQRLDRAGIPLALGTDSLASNPDLSVFEEARYLAARVDGPSPDRLIRMLTRDGARALQVADTHGSLTVGQRADWVVLEPGSPITSTSLDGLFHPNSRILNTWILGQPIGSDC